LPNASLEPRILSFKVPAKGSPAQLTFSSTNEPSGLTKAWHGPRRIVAPQPRFRPEDLATPAQANRSILWRQRLFPCQCDMENI